MPGSLPANPASYCPAEAAAEAGKGGEAEEVGERLKVLCVRLGIYSKQLCTDMQSRKHLCFHLKHRLNFEKGSEDEISTFWGKGKDRYFGST